jgi:hypothetical protein
MHYVNLDKQNILHCDNCGASFFEENGINRISLSSAEKLAADKKTDEIEGQEKLCPLDHLPLIPLTDSNIPENVTLLKCKKCQGVFAFPDDLINFKKAQTAKIEFFKAWSKPLPSLRTVLVISFTALILGSVLYQFNSFLKYSSAPSQASDLIKSVTLSKSGRYLFIFFKTPTPFKSRIIFQDLTVNKQTEKIINSSPATSHQLTTGDLNLEDQILYQIILTNSKGVEIKTDIKKITF